MGDTGDNVGVKPSPSTTTMFHPTPNNTNQFPDTDVPHLASRTAILGLFIIVGFVGNCVLLATISQSVRLKKSMLNLFVISAVIVNLIDCLVNMPLILGATIMEKWDYGAHACKIHAFLILTTSIEMCLSLTLMAFDRCLAVENPVKYAQRLTLVKSNILIVYTWVHSVALSFPLLVDVVHSELIPARYLCSVAKNSPLAYVSVISTFGYIIPVLLNIVFYIIIIRQRVKQKLSESHLSDELFDQSRFWMEVNAAKFVASLFITWCLLQGPYLLTNSIEQYRNSKEYKSTLPFQYSWEMEFAFTWMKFSYPMFLPFATFFWRKEVWQRFKNLILCRKSIQIKDASPKHPSPKRQMQNNSKRDAENGKPKMDVPVIFATSKGLHVQSKKPKDVFSSAEDMTAETMSQGQESSIVTTRGCDVFGSRELAQIEDDTSDYDSHEETPDPFAGSDPVVIMARKEKNVSVDRPRSLSMISYNKNEKHKKSAFGNTEVLSPSEVDANSFSDYKAVSKQNKRKKRKKSKEEDLINTEDIQEVNENLGDISDERISNDSGRGTVEKARKHSDKSEEHVGDGTVQTENHFSTKDEDKTSNNIQESSEVPRKKKRKKKKSKEHKSKVLELDTITSTQETVVEAEDKEYESGNSLPKRPHRLAPLEHKSMSNANNVDFSNYQENLEIIVNHTKRNGSRYGEDIIEEGGTSFTHSAQNNTRSGSRGRRKTNSSTQPQADNQNSSDLSKVQEQSQRKRTISSGDSQTNLLGSNTSSELSGVSTYNSSGAQSAARKKRRAAKAKSSSQLTLLEDNP